MVLKFTFVKLSLISYNVLLIRYPFLLFVTQHDFVDSLPRLECASVSLQLSLRKLVEDWWVWLEVNFSDWAVRFRWEVAHACTYQDRILRGFNASGIVLQPLCPKLSQLKMTYLNTWEALYQINWEVLNEPTVLGCPKGSKLRPCIYSVWWGFSEKTLLHWKIPPV